MERQLPLADIRAFVTIAQCGSFTKAAEQLSVSRAHLSRQLNQLEANLGAQLLVRTTRSQRLTAVGQRFYQRCQRSLQDIEQAIDTVFEDSEQLAGDIAINCVGGVIGENIVASLLAQFQQQYPDIRLSLDLTSPRVDLINQEVDLVIRMGALQDSSLIARKLCDIEITCVASPQYLAQAAVLTSPAQLDQHRCITGTVKQWRFYHQKKTEKQEVTLTPVFECKNGNAMIAAALQHLGIIRLPKPHCQREIDDGQLVEVFDDWHIQSVPLYLLYSQKHYQPLRLQRLIDFLCHEFQQPNT
ncbi:HTH-type transcriptional regulator PgrR [Sinobacterium norvegicum]|uniref:HTH-type transcriptional regulator PgrR n=1 Tax=Sinobacterium norvegicum TaxID=1641715 RepID=A0ABM9ADP7_9GAMM|nr:LysR family transcriptional regulator [Sinobacterium norvegicum]CAH0991336.1 HTH-type transcriptional regulator PgrR [Sinobacterium norvegicum]